MTRSLESGTSRRTSKGAWTRRRQQVYLRALATTPGLSIHTSTFLVSKQWMPLAFPSRWLVPVIRTEEKGSDVSLGAYLLLDAFNHESDFAIVVTNDSDLRERIELVQAPPFEMPVWVINPHRKKAAALKLSHHLDLHRDDVRSCQFPRVMTATNGRLLRQCCALRCVRLLPR